MCITIDRSDLFNYISGPLFRCRGVCFLCVNGCVNGLAMTIPKYIYSSCCGLNEFNMDNSYYYIRQRPKTYIHIGKLSDLPFCALTP